MKAPALWFTLVLAGGTGLAAAEVRPGASLEEVRGTLGLPRGQVQVAGRQVLYYERGEVELQNGAVTRVALRSEEEHASLTARQERQLNERAERVPKTLERVTTSHEMNWANACKGVGTASTPFSYAAPLTEVMLLGLVALRSGQGRKLVYDGEAMRVTNAPDANAFLGREYRAGWSL